MTTNLCPSTPLPHPPQPHPRPPPHPRSAVQSQKGQELAGMQSAKAAELEAKDAELREVQKELDAALETQKMTKKVLATTSKSYEDAEAKGKKLAKVGRSGSAYFSVVGGRATAYTTHHSSNSPEKKRNSLPRRGRSSPSRTTSMPPRPRQSSSRSSCKGRPRPVKLPATRKRRSRSSTTRSSRACVP